MQETQIVTLRKPVHRNLFEAWKKWILDPAAGVPINGSKYYLLLDFKDWIFGEGAPIGVLISRKRDEQKGIKIRLSWKMTEVDFKDSSLEAIFIEIPEGDESLLVAGNLSKKLKKQVALPDEIEDQNFDSSESESEMI